VEVDFTALGEEVKSFGGIPLSHVSLDLSAHSYTQGSSTFTMPSTYKKDKPWDTDDIDKWKVSCDQKPLK
jgi:hypothetical protein